MSKDLPHTGTELNEEQSMVLRWLSKEDASSLGECDGVSLRFLVRAGLAKITPTNRGGGFDFVSVTDAGWSWLKEHPAP